jgi:hypothetical protein
MFFHSVSVKIIFEYVLKDLKSAGKMDGGVFCSVVIWTLDTDFFDAPVTSTDMQFDMESWTESEDFCHYPK